MFRRLIPVIMAVPFAVGLLASPAASAQGAEDWIGLDDTTPLLLGADARRDSNGDPGMSLLIDAPLASETGFTGSWAVSEINDAGQTFTSHSLAAAIWLQLSTLLEVELRYFFDGDPGELEREALGINFGLDIDEWRLDIEFSEGQTLIYTRDIGIDLIDNRVPEFIDTDVAGRGISVGRQGQYWYWRLGYRQFDYQQDLGRLATSRLLQQVVSSSALAQSGLLIAEQSSLLLGRGDFDSDFSLLIARARSAIDDSEAESLGLGWLHWGNGNLGYQLSATAPLPLNQDLGLSLGLRWIL